MQDCVRRETLGEDGDGTVGAAARQIEQAQEGERKRLARDNIHLLEREERPNLSHLEPAGGAGGKETAEKPNKIRGKFGKWRPVGESNPCFQRERLAS